ncbi:MAG: DUF4177 domain-containing protein [Halanaerobiales bacterium]|nr:DUF4177 domain-containing protein [Halanaerobiales bacterium]
MKMKYEYKIIDIYSATHDFELERKINELAKEGWKLKLIHPVTKASNYDRELIFEREIIESGR